ncbi:trigger factor [Urechidicola croceus]|uniref:Trigger factor n=1 Tax=Urechidicola croceus TaxID=1850246 RepID=A0A1D8P7T8_9FLAO|nr:trigger factor [Urechidicola croceus]AOW20634.1 trigger factor [Urechidicola croceus]
MNITKESIDALNAVVKIEISEADYQEKVTEILKDYSKKASVPGFRKGHVPFGMIKKQYGKSVMIDEVNKLIQDSLNNFLTEEKLDILGNPLPKMQDDFSWEEKDYSFEFELGLAPTFDVNLDTKKKITEYTIVADDALINKEVENLQQRFGKMSAKDVIEEGVNITGVFVNEEKEIEKKYSFILDDVKGKTNQKKFLGSKVGDVLELKSKGLFSDEHKLMGATGLGHDEVHGLEIPLTFTVEDITFTELADLDQELFDKIFGKDIVTSVTELKEKIKEDAEKQFQSQADQQLLNSITEYLIENTKFDLPAEFLKKWLAVAGENPLSEEQASEEFEKSEKGLRYQLIEGSIIKDNKLQVTFEELKEYAKGFIKSQMAQYGNLDPAEEELENIANRVLGNQDEAKRLQEQLMSGKLLEFYKEKLTFKSKEVTYEDFVKEVYK